MDNGIFDEKVIEASNNIYVSYILRDNADFYEIGYRAMKSNNMEHMIPCHHMKYNGKVKLVYFLDERVPFKDKIKQLENDQIEPLLNNLLQVIKKVEENGFINLECIDNRLDRIYVDNDSNDIKLIYLPIVTNSFINDKNKLENRICQQLIQLIDEIGIDGNSKIGEVIHRLDDDNTLKLDDIIVTFLKISKQDEERRMKQEAEGIHSNQLTLKSSNEAVVFQINQDDFIIGKSRNKVDGLILDNPTVSRVHCKISRAENEFYVTDLGSSNGTYLNLIRLAPNIPTLIKDGDQIRISNIDFLVWRP